MVQPDGFDRLLSTQKSRSGFQGYRLVRSEGGPWPLLGKRIVPIKKAVIALGDVREPNDGSARHFGPNSFAMRFAQCRRPLASSPASQRLIAALKRV